MATLFPIQALQPAIAGASGRVYLAGKGLVALDNGKVTWKHASDEPLYASSFEDGSLAVANGKRLDFMKLDGISISRSMRKRRSSLRPPSRMTAACGARRPAPFTSQVEEESNQWVSALPASRR